MLRTIAIALVVLAILGGGALYWARKTFVAASEAPPEPAHVADPESTRALPGGGEVVGFVGRYGSHVWQGIPYAKPPIGDLRWRAPEPPVPTAGTRQALAFGNHCPQPASRFAGVTDVPEGTITGDEDCLYLNVYAPRMERSEVAHGRPVMLWIHGGGNVVGLADRYDGGRLAQTHDVVVVTVNYRMGSLGWFRHASLREGVGPVEQSGNFATLDLIRALEWVRDHIAAFGGDPANVTIFGQSSGGANVFSLLLSPQANGLFHRAIAESGGVYTDSPAEAENFHDAAEPGHERSSNEVLVRLLVADGQAPDLASARARLASMSAAEVAAYLRGQTPAQLFAAYAREVQEGLLDLPRLFADGVVRPAGDPHARFASPDGWSRVPVLLGTNRDENKLFLFANPLYVDRVLGVVPRVKDPHLYLATAGAMAAMWKATGVDGPAAAIWTTQPNVFAYRWDWDEEPTLLGLDVASYVGASHGFEVPFVFGHWDLGKQGNVIFTAENHAAREALSEQMMSYWAQFAWAGDPGRGRDGDQVAWMAWDGRPGGHKTLLLDTAAGGGLRMGSEPVTPSSVLASVEQDPRLVSQRDRCWVYRELADWSRGFDRSGYATAGRAGCGPYPFDEFPWNGD